MTRCLKAMKGIVKAQRKEKIIHFGGIRGITEVPFNRVLKDASQAQLVEIREMGVSGYLKQEDIKEYGYIRLQRRGKTSKGLEYRMHGGKE